MTYLTEEVLLWLLASKAQVIVLQEHHLVGNAYHSKVRRLCKVYKVISAPATRTVGKGSTAGCMILVRKGYTVLSNKQYGLVNTANTTYCLLRMKKMTLCIASVYLHPTNQALNMNILYTLQGVASRIGCPYLFLGDYNMEPGEIQEIQWGPAIQGKVFTPNDLKATCYQGTYGSLIDYGIGSQSLTPYISSMEPIYDAPVPTHIGIRYMLEVQPAQNKTMQLVRPKPMPIPEIGPHLQEWDWSRSQEVARRILARPNKRAPHAQQMFYSIRLEQVDRTTAMAVACKLWSCTYEV